MEEEQEYNVGNLLPFRNLTEEQRDLFIKLVSDDYSHIFQILFNVIEDDDVTLELIDILAGQRIQFPTRKKLYKLLEKIKIYTYIKNRGNSNESCQTLAKIYKKRVSQIKAVINRIDYLLANGKYRDIEKLESEQEEQA